MGIQCLTTRGWGWDTGMHARKLHLREGRKDKDKSTKFEEVT